MLTDTSPVPMTVLEVWRHLIIFVELLSPVRWIVFQKNDLVKLYMICTLLNRLASVEGKGVFRMRIKFIRLRV